MFDFHGNQMRTMHDLISDARRRNELMDNFDNHDCRMSTHGYCGTCEDYALLMQHLKGKCFNKDGVCEPDNCRCGN